VIFLFKETLIKRPAAVYTADFAQGLGKNTRKNTSITAFFSCARRQNQRRIQRQAINQCFPTGRVIIDGNIIRETVR
jgi:hypothetical protein